MLVKDNATVMSMGSASVDNHEISLKTCYVTCQVVIILCTVGIVGSDPVSAVLHSELPHTQLNKLLFITASMVTVQQNTLG